MVEVTEERDLGLTMRIDMKCRIQCVEAVKTVNRVLGMIKRTFTVSIVIQLCKSFIRPH